jgi:hypothetical protein
MKQHLEKHPETVNPDPKEVSMKSIDKQTVARSPNVLPPATSATTPATGSETQTASPTTASATTSNYSLVAAPPDVTMPTPPAGFAPYDLNLYKGYRLKTAQVALIPQVVTELQAATTRYTAKFGSMIPGAEQVADKLDRAGQWIAMRAAAQAFLRYAMTFEAMAVKDAVLVLEQITAQFDVTAAASPASIAEFSALQKLLDVPKTFGKRSASTRSKKAKAKASATTTATTTPAAPSATNPGTTTPAPANAAPANGGAAH